MEGQGCVTFLSTAKGAGETGPCDTYQGQFGRSTFHGLGTYTWASGRSLSGCFREGRCNEVGCKAYPGGQVYYGELKADLEHGKGVLMQGDTRLIGLWREGQLVQELFETFVPALDLDAIEGEGWQKVYGGIRETREETERKRKEKERLMRAASS